MKKNRLMIAVFTILMLCFIGLPVMAGTTYSVKGSMYGYDSAIHRSDYASVTATMPAQYGESITVNLVFTSTLQNDNKQGNQQGQDVVRVKLSDVPLSYVFDGNSYFKADAIYWIKGPLTNNQWLLRNGLIEIYNNKLEGTKIVDKFNIVIFDDPPEENPPIFVSTFYGSSRSFNITPPPNPPAP